MIRQQPFCTCPCSDDETPHDGKLCPLHDDTMKDFRIVLCDTCGSEGRIYRGLYEDERDCGPCPVCEGTGSEVIEVEPVELEDLETDQPAQEGS